MSRARWARAGPFAGKISRLLSRISIRLLAFNVLLVFLPAIGILTLESFEKQLLDAQERNMVQQGRLLAAALGGLGSLDANEAERILVNLAQRQEVRLRVVSPNGTVLADSSRLGPRLEDAVAGAGYGSAVRERTTYRIGLFFYRLLERMRGRPEPTDQRSAPDPVLAGAGDRILTPEVRQALAGRYGSAARPSPTSRSLVLFSALPIEDHGTVLGAVLVSRSTVRILEALYEFRIATTEVILLSLVVAAVLSLLVSTTIARPLRRLQREARALLDRRGRLRGSLVPLARQDEIGDLSRALAVLTRRLDEHQAFMESFASDLSHEFKNPLAAIRSVLEVLPEIDEPVARNRFLAMAQADVARLEQMLTSVREIAIIDSQLGRHDTEDVPLAQMVRASIDRRTIGGSGPGFSFEPPAEPFAVSAAPLHITQVIDNLLDNAASFSPPDATVDVSLRRHRDRAELRVADRGPGIPEGNLDRLFDRFFSDRPGKPKGADGHAGLGLAIVKAIVQGYGGEVRAQNRAGGGTEMTVELPAIDLPTPATS